MRRVLQLDGLRGIAILMVFFYHSLDLPLLWAGVDLFFVMSGYLITKILLRLRGEVSAAVPFGTGYWRAFYSRRARRILPPYFLFLLIAGLCFSIPWSGVWYWYAFFGADFLSAMNRVPVLALVPLWSLAVEEQFYLVWPWVVRVANCKVLKTTAIVVILTAPVLRALCTPLFQTHWPIYALPFFRADTIAWGAFIAVSEYDSPSWISLRRPLAGMVAVTAGIILGGLSAFSFFRHHANSISFNSLGYTLVGTVFGSGLVYVLGSQHGFVHWILTRRALRYLGKTSYTFYLYHLGVLAMVQHSMHSRSLACAAALLITLAITTVSWTFLESPILNRPTMKSQQAHAG